MVIFRLVLGLVVIFLLVAFSMANLGDVTLNFYFYQTPPIPLFVVIFISLLLGVFLAWGMVVSEQLKLKSGVRSRDKKIRNLQSELEKLEKRLASMSEVERPAGESEVISTKMEETSVVDEKEEGSPAADVQVEEE